MNSELQGIEVLEVLNELNGLDLSIVLSCLKTARERFEDLDSKALAFFKDSSDGEILEARLYPNQSLYTDEKPIQESIFLYFDLSTSIELLNYIMRLKCIIDECVGINNIRFSDLKLQHSTAFIDLLGNDLGVDNELLERVKVQYEPIIKDFLPFNLTIIGPHLFDTGGIVLEGTVYSRQFYKLREAASQHDSHIPNGVQRGIHNIIHSSIGYITKATSKQLLKLYRDFESMRGQQINIPIRVRDARVIATRNKRLIGQPIIIPFQGERSNNLPEKTICSFLQNIRDLAPKWSNNNELKNFVWEEALYWIESNHVTSIQRLAKEIIDRC